MKKQIKTELLKISELTFDQVNELYYPRLAIDYQTVENYAKKMEAGETFPNPKIGHLRSVTKNIVVDGRHTIEALKKRKVEYVTCDIYLFDSEKELFAAAVKFNATHGRPLSSQDEELIVSRLKEYEFSVEEIQKIIHVPAAEIKKANSYTEAYTVTGPSFKKTTVKVKPELKEPEPPKSPESPDLTPGIPTMSLQQNISRNGAVLEAIEFKNNLKRMITFLKNHRLPDDEESKALIRQIRGLMVIEVD
jgi:hypothetical protein